MNCRPRITTGGFILHAGLDKWRGGEDLAQRVHGMAAQAYPFLAKVAPTTFLKALAASEIALGAALLVPIVPRRIAALGLTAFAGGLLGLYFRTPGMRRPGSVWPSPSGTAIAKDVWLLGIGLTLAAMPNNTASEI